jgi:uncharacterized iron-regulated protein
MAKKTKLAGKSLYDLVATKSKKFLDRLKAPLEKAKLKRDFANKVADATAAIYDNKAAIVELLMEVKDVNVDAILELNKENEEIYNDIVGIGAIYTNIFGEDLEVEISPEDLIVSSADILSQATEIDEEDED